MVNQKAKTKVLPKGIRKYRHTTHLQRLQKVLQKHNTNV